MSKPLKLVEWYEGQPRDEVKCWTLNTTQFVCTIFNKGNKFKLTIQRPFIQRYPMASSKLHQAKLEALHLVTAKLTEMQVCAEMYRNEEKRLIEEKNKKPLPNLLNEQDGQCGKCENKRVIPLVKMCAKCLWEQTMSATSPGTQ